MKAITKEKLKRMIKSMCIEANTFLDREVYQALIHNREHETSEIAVDVLESIIKNADLAEAGKKPLCQDTGIGVFFVEMGREVDISGVNLTETITEVIAEIYDSESYRMSVVTDPLFSRENTGSNTPPIIHWEITEGDSLKITFLPKGGGAENMSRLKMFNPLTGREEIKSYIVETVKAAGGRPCPPVIVGVGIGGTFDYVGYLAKKALLRPLSEPNQDPQWADFEVETLDAINQTGIGPMGLGGKTTALAVKVMAYPCHIASLPVAVNLQCHSHRHASIII